MRPPCARSAGMLFMTAQVVRYAFEAWESHGDSMIIRSSASLTVGSNISSARGSSSDHRSVAPALFTAGCLLASLTWNAVAALNAIWPVGVRDDTRKQLAKLLLSQEHEHTVGHNGDWLVAWQRIQP